MGVGASRSTGRGGGGSAAAVVVVEEDEEEEEGEEGEEGEEDGAFGGKEGGGGLADGSLVNPGGVLGAISVYGLDWRLEGAVVFLSRWIRRH